ncbi:MAG: sulfotransferase family 2 domain-containing protein [Xenococcus sp. (in: cyanobacteria)]
MIISHKHKFIFLKTNKTAGTSIEIALSKYCGPHDIITPISPEDEKTRIDMGFLGSQNYLSPIWDYSIRDVAKAVLKGKRKLRFYNHISAKEVKQYISQEMWDSYYKFCFERNPWDRIVSFYYWHYKSEPRPTISEFIESKVPLILKQRGIELYSIDGQIVVDQVCRFENISEELEVVRKKLGIPEKLNLPKSKSKYRKDKRSYHDILSDEERVKIAELFSDEINLCGYEFIDKREFDKTKF